MEKRRSRRFPRRMTVRYGENELDRSGITYDISSTGAFIVASQLPPLDTRVHLQVMLDTHRSVFLEGTVRRHRVVPPSLRQLQRGGFGVRFLTPGELISEIVPQLAAGNRFEIAFEDRDRFVQAWEQQIRHGGIFLITEKKLARDTEVLLEFKLSWLRKSWTFSAQVVQVMEAGTRGVAVVFTDRGEVDAALRPHLA